ncbi:tyrosine-type recombinase/integrase [Streptomyces sp. NPDC056638]|uniref:tyrosine-type recombinase/integrase n=1 Tax=Streptomyces sp. NPDC056638 TaxID=3345887 RepID=UPI0036966F56
MRTGPCSAAHAPSARSAPARRRACSLDCSPDFRGVARRAYASSRITNPDARLFTGPRGGRISTAVLRDATHWDEVVTSLGHEHLRRHDLRHTGLTWFADAGVPAHVLREIAGHDSLLTTQRYLHPDMTQISNAGHALTAHLNPIRTPLTLAVQPAAGRRR